jgi:hypothetical protein
MKRIIRTSALALATTVLAAGCIFSPDFAGSAPQIPRHPSIAGDLRAPTPNPPAVAMPAASPVAEGHTNYGVASNWLCRPGLPGNPCEVNIDATVVKADGSTELETFTRNPNPPIDCFYVYPTVSLDPFTQSDLIPGPEEFNVVKAQLARLGSQCRIFAPMYRQFSLGALRARMSGAGDVPVRGTPADANNDVDDA